ncbi:hypothetical protein NX059_004367 [Plenodomus lindquistii]|nr:hypothetical protein NX059_004367 [Plenodomus lindquistii]
MIFLVSLCLTTYTLATCDRALLQTIAASYLEAQTSGTPTLLPIAPNISYTENDVPLSPNAGVLAHALTIDLSRNLFDTTTCAFFTEITSATDPHPYVIDTQIHVSPSTNLVTSMQSVVADSGDWVFNATSHLRWSRSESWAPIDAAHRNSRAVILAAANAYLDSWANGSISVPYGTPCARLEGGAYTGERSPTTNTCYMPEFPKPAFTGAGNRRYVVDEVIGAVGVLNDFPFIDTVKPEGAPSSNLMRVEGGRIRYIHETTVCATRGCGR